MDVVIGSMTSLNEFRLVTLKHVNMKAGGSEKWKPPTIGTVKINVDASFFQNTNIGSSGFVVRDSDGRFLAGGGQSYKGVISAEHVEALACKQAVQFAIMHHFVPAVIETDAQGVYLQLLNNQQNNFSILGRLYDDIGALLQASGSIRIAHTKRSANQVAYSMAAHSSSLTIEIFYFTVPSFIQAAVAAEFPIM
ncbi:hypothetical protein ACLB2K_029621 [Fragaria x ananassa]